MPAILSRPTQWTSLWVRPGIRISKKLLQVIMFWQDGQALDTMRSEFPPRSTDFPDPVGRLQMQSGCWFSDSGGGSLPPVGLATACVIVNYCPGLVSTDLEAPWGRGLCPLSGFCQFLPWYLVECKCYINVGWNNEGWSSVTYLIRTSRIHQAVGN